MSRLPKFSPWQQHSTPTHFDLPPASCVFKTLRLHLTSLHSCFHRTLLPHFASSLQSCFTMVKVKLVDLAPCAEVGCAASYGGVLPTPPPSPTLEGLSMTDTTTVDEVCLHSPLNTYCAFPNFLCKTLTNGLTHRKSNTAPSQQSGFSFQTFSSLFLSTTGSRSPARAISSSSHPRPQSRRFLTTTTNTRSQRKTMSTPTFSKNHSRDSKPTPTLLSHAVFSTARSAASKMASRASIFTSPSA